MKSIQDLRQEHHNRAKQLREYVEKNNASWSDKHQAHYDQEMKALGHLADQVQGIEASLQLHGDQHQTSGRSLQEQYRDVANGRVVAAMRTPSDFRAHYATMSAAGRDEEIGLGDFLRGVAGARTSPGVQAALSIGTDSAGGYTVPTMVMPGILEALTPASSLLSAGAGIVPLAGDGAKNYTLAAINAVPTAAWRAENGAVAESEPTFRAVVATPRSLSFYFKVSRELLMDSPNVDRALRTAIAASMAKELDRTGLRGTGTAPEPRGVLNTVGVQSVTNGAAGTALATIKWANLLSAYQAIRGADAPPPTAAIMSARTMTGFASLADSTGQPLQRPDLLNSLRFIDTSAVPNNLTVGASTDCTEVYVADFTRLKFFMRELLSIQLANEVFATSGQVGFICHCRADVAVEYPSAFAVITGLRP